MDYKKALTNLDLVYPDGIAKGFPLWTEKGIEIQHITAKIFIDIFSDNNVEINYPRQIRTLKEFSHQYKNRIDKYDSSLPVFDLKNKKNLFITDNLPYNLRKLDTQNIDSMLTYYYVLRLLNAKQIPMSRDYYISPLLQYNLAIKNKNKKDAINYVLKSLKEFCNKINLPSVILEYSGVDKYSEKVYMVASLNQKMETQAIIQCSLLSNELLDIFELSDSLKDKIIFDIGYSQKLFAYLAYNNMDEYGMRLPSIYEKKDVAIIYNDNINSLIIKLLKNNDIVKENVYFDNSLGKKKLKKTKNEYINKGVRNLIVQNYNNNQESYILYSVNKTDCKLFTFDDIYDIVNKIKFEMDNFYFKKMNAKIEEIQKTGYSFVSEFKEKGKVIN